MLRGLKQRFPQVHLKAFTMVEIGYLAQRAQDDHPRSAGAAARRRHGFAARAAARRSSASACGASSATTRSTGEEWIETARTAHELGLHSNCTMLYGHIENEEDRVDHL